MLYYILGRNLSTTIELRDGKEVESISFSIKELLSGKKEEAKENLYFYVEEYVAFKGEKFAKELFKKYQIASDILDELALVNTLEPLEVSIFHEIIDMVDVEEMYQFLTTIVNVPSSLKDVFIPDGNETLNEVQTYTKTEYLELITLATVLKLILPVIGKYMYIKSSLIGKYLREILFLPILTSHPRLKMYREADWIEACAINPKLKEDLLSRTFNKLCHNAERVYNKERGDESDSVISILYCIPKDEIVKWVFSMSVFLGVMSTSTTRDSEQKDLIRSIYNAILRGKVLKSTENTNIKNKANTIGGSGGEETQESVSESCRVTTSLTPGTVEVINWTFKSIQFLSKQLPLSKFTIDKDIADDMYRKLMDINKETPFVIPESTFCFVGTIFQSTLAHYDSHPYLRAKEILADISIAFSHLWVNGFKDLALFIVSKKNVRDDDEDEESTFNNSASNKTKIPDELMDELNSYYPVDKNKFSKLSKTETQSIPEITIGWLSDIMSKEEYITLASREQILEVKGNSYSPIIVPSQDLKIRLAELILFINKRDSNIEL